MPRWQIIATKLVVAVVATVAAVVPAMFVAGTLAGGARVGVDLNPGGGLTVRTSDYGTFTRALPAVAVSEKIRVTRVLPTDESLESVFSYLVGAA